MKKFFLISIFSGCVVASELDGVTASSSVTGRVKCGEGRFHWDPYAYGRSLQQQERAAQREIAAAKARRAEKERIEQQRQLAEQTRLADAGREAAAKQQRLAQQAFTDFIRGLARKETLTPEELAVRQRQVGWERFKEGVLSFAERRDSLLQDKQVVIYRYLAQESSKIGDFDNFFYCTIGIANILSNQRRNVDSFMLLQSLFNPIPDMSPGIQQSVENRHLVSAFLGMLKNFQHFTRKENEQFQLIFNACFERAKQHFIPKKLTHNQRQNLIRAGLEKILS